MCHLERFFSRVALLRFLLVRRIQLLVFLCLWFSSPFVFLDVSFVVVVVVVSIFVWKLYFFRATYTTQAQKLMTWVTFGSYFLTEKRKLVSNYHASATKKTWLDKSIRNFSAFSVNNFQTRTIRALNTTYKLFTIFLHVRVKHCEERRSESQSLFLRS